MTETNEVVQDCLTEAKSSLSKKDSEKFLNIISTKDVKTNVTNWGSYFTYKKKEYGPYKSHDDLVNAVLKIVK